MTLRSSLLLAVAPLSGVLAAGVYNSSTTPSSLPWNTYNYCNAPHVNAKHYTLPDEHDVELVYLNIIMRHHKVHAVPLPTLLIILFS
jgi:hypothetical protein